MSTQSTDRGFTSGRILAKRPFSPAVKHLPDPRRVFEDLLVCESEHREATASKRRVPANVGSASIPMATAIDFDDQLQITAIEIDDVGNEYNLSSKTVPMKFSPAYHLPKRFFAPRW